MLAQSHVHTKPSCNSPAGANLPLQWPFLPFSGSRLDGKLLLGKDASSERGGMLSSGRTVDLCPKKTPASDAAKQPSSGTTTTSSTQNMPKISPPKLHRPKSSSSCPTGGDGEAGSHPRCQEASSGLTKDCVGLEGAAGRVSRPGPNSLLAQTAAPPTALQSDLLEERIAPKKKQLPASVDINPRKGHVLKAVEATCGSHAGAHSPQGKAAEAPRTRDCLPEQQKVGGDGEPAVPAQAGQREEFQQRVTEATVCAKNIKVSSTGEKVVLWTRYMP